MKVAAAKTLNRRKFLGEVCLALSGAALANEFARRTAHVNFAKELWLLFQPPKHSNLTYGEALPPQLVQGIEDRIGTFGFADLLAVPELYRMTEEGIYFIKPENSGNYDCVSSSLDVFDELAENRESIPNYMGHRIRQGYDKRGINTQHFWVELLIKNGWNVESITIDMTPAYKGKNPEHWALDNIPMIRSGAIVKLGNGMMYSSHWEDSNSQNIFVSAMGLKQEEGKTFAQYSVDSIPNDLSQEVTRYQLWIDMGSFEMRPLKAKINGTKNTGHGHALDFKQEEVSIAQVLSLIPPKDMAALRTMVKAYTGIEPNFHNTDDLYTNNLSR